MGMTETKDSSELYGLLNNIGGLMACYAGAARTPSRSHILEAVAQEAEMLCGKLKRMRERWTVFLPFHEAIDVKFVDWATDVQGWVNLLGVPLNPLSSGFVLDMVSEPVGELEGELKRAVPEICHKIDGRLAERWLDWESKAYSELGSELSSSSARAAKQLLELKYELNELEEFFNSELSERQFKVLSLRLYHRDCKEAVKAARNEVNKAHNSWPAKNVVRRALAMKEAVKGQILAHQVYRGLADYIDLDYPEMFDEAPFGQFIFMNRHQLKEGDVPAVVKMLEMIQLLNGYVDPKGTQRQKDRQAMGRELTAEEKQVVKGLLQLVEKARWRSGATTASMSQGLQRMLGVEYALEGELAEMSDDLWKLLKSRPRCDAEKSQKVTWLNIVGWCVRKGYLNGSGSPALCKEFYPRAGEDDYKAIDKGRNEPPASFKKIEPLLEKFLR